MSADLCLVNGYGICLTNLNWRDSKIVEEFLKDTDKWEEPYVDYVDYIDDHLSTSLERATICATSSEYLYYGAIYPLKQNEIYLMTKEEMAKEIYTIMAPLVEDTEEDILNLLSDVFDWEVC